MTETINITSPVARMVGGSLYKLNPKTDQRTNQPVLGVDGKPVMQGYFAIAVPKMPGEQHFSQTAWGAQLWALGHASAQAAAQRRDFAWKIEDGDSREPNKRGRVNADREGYPGHWIIKFSGGFLPSTHSLIGLAAGSKPAPLMEANAIQPGYYVQVNFNAVFNQRIDSPGIYLNPQMVCLLAYGPVIVVGPDVDSAKFGANVQLPPGASLVPVAALIAPAPAVQTYQPPPPGAAYTPPAPAAYTPPAPAYQPPPPAGPIAPHPAITTAPPPPAAPSGPRMTAKANGVPYESYITAGWTDATLRQMGMME